MKRDWYGEYEAIAERGGKPTLLLHVCCAPCMSAGIERLARDFRVTAYFYNPNIVLRSEYDRRLSAVKKLIAETGLDIPVTDGGYDPSAYDECVGKLRGSAEGGEKCRLCMAARTEAAAEEAKRQGCEYVTTTLTASPLKNADYINETGERAAREHNVKWLPTDFKKKGGCVRTKELCDKYGIYRQHYCGCTPNKIVVAVTGGIASGKSTFTGMFAALGADTIDADKITRELQTPGHAVYDEIARAFPECFDGGTADRKKLAATVFSDAEKLKLLESIVHPAVKEELMRRIAQSTAKVVVAEVPLLFESGMSDFADVIVNVSSSDDVRRARAKERNGMTSEMFDKVRSRQWTDEMRRAASDVTVLNDGDSRSLGNRARELYGEWLKLTGN